MIRDLVASIVAVIAFTVLLGIAYPLMVTGIAQVTMESKADGSPVRRGGHIVGSKLVAQAFDEAGDGDTRTADPRWFQPRPSQTGYSAQASGFLNEGPNQQALADLYSDRVKAYLQLEGDYVDGLTAADVPIDAVTNSASGIDPLISVANARLQANRIARLRDVDRDELLDLIDRHTTSRAFGLFGERGVNVLELNLDLDEEHPVR